LQRGNGFAHYRVFYCAYYQIHLKSYFFQKNYDSCSIFFNENLLRSMIDCTLKEILWHKIFFSN